MYIRSDHNINRLAESGRSRQPLYHRQPILHEEECPANVVAEGSKLTDAQAPTVGEQSTGNIVMCMQNVTVAGNLEVKLSRSQSEAEVSIF